MWLQYLGKEVKHLKINMGAVALLHTRLSSTNGTSSSVARRLPKTFHLMESQSYCDLMRSPSHRVVN